MSLEIFNSRRTWEGYGRQTNNCDALWSLLLLWCLAIVICDLQNDYCTPTTIRTAQRQRYAIELVHDPNSHDTENSN